MDVALALLTRFWKPLLIGLALVALWFGAVGLKHAYDDERRAEGAAPIQKKLDQYIKTAQERTTAMTMAWNEKRHQADQLAQERDHAIAEKLAAAKRAAATLPPAVAAIVVPADVVRLLNDPGPAVDPAGAARPPEPTPRADAAVPGPADPAGPESNFGLMVETWRSARVLYEACVERVALITEFYDSLRAVQAVPPVPSQ